MVLFCLLTNFCIGLSIGPLTYPSPILPLQLKNVSNFPIFERMDWTINNDNTLSCVANLNVTIKDLDHSLVIAQNGGRLKGLKFPGLYNNSENRNITKLRTKDNRCITVMRCNPRDTTDRNRTYYCNPLSNRPIRRLSQATLGTYLKLLRCDPLLNTAQRFYKMDHNCTLTKLTHCQEYPECKQWCSLTTNPTQSPTTNNNTTDVEYEDEYEYEIVPTLQPTTIIEPEEDDNETIPSMAPSSPSPTTIIDNYYNITLNPSSYSPTTTTTTEEEQEQQPNDNELLALISLVAILPIGIAGYFYFFKK